MPHSELRILLRVTAISTSQPSAKENGDLPNCTLQGNGGFHSHPKFDVVPEFRRSGTSNPSNPIEVVSRQEFLNEVLMALDAFKRMELKHEVQSTFATQSN